MRSLHRITRGAVSFPSAFVCSSCLARQRPRILSSAQSNSQYDNARGFSLTASRTSGHSRWSTIKHDKAKNDKAKSKQRVIYSDEITLSSRLFGPDPKSNPRLDLAITRAKKDGFPKASIEAAIARGQGLTSSGAKLEALTEEVMFPPSVGIIVEFMTESKAQTRLDLRKVVKDCGGTFSSTSYLFDKKGRISFREKDGMDFDTIMEPALDAGALDVEDSDDGGVVVYTQVSNMKSVSDALTQKLGLEIKELEIIWDPQTRVDVDSELVAGQLEKFTDLLKDIPSVQGVYMNTAD